MDSVQHHEKASYILVFIFTLHFSTNFFLKPLVHFALSHFAISFVNHDSVVLNATIDVAYFVLFMLQIRKCYFDLFILSSLYDVFKTEARPRI